MGGSGGGGGGGGREERTSPEISERASLFFREFRAKNKKINKKAADAQSLHIFLLIGLLVHA